MGITRQGDRTRVEGPQRHTSSTSLMGVCPPSPAGCLRMGAGPMWNVTGDWEAKQNQR